MEVAVSPAVQDGHSKSICSLLLCASGVRQGNEEDLVVAPKQPCGRFIKPIVELRAVKLLPICLQRKCEPQGCIQSAPASGKASKHADIELLLGRCDNSDIFGQGCRGRLLHGNNSMLRAITNIVQPIA